MRKKIITLSLFLFVGLCAFAQSVTVEGVVKEASTGETLPGVSVSIKGTTIGTETDFDGSYRLSNVQMGATLVFNYLGLKTAEVVVTATEVNVSLQEGAEKLEEIIVIGYGTQRKKETTGAVSVVSSEAIEDLKPTRIEQALQGQVAGVNITSTSGAPGAGLNIRIRGISTNGDNRPLILVDGNRIEDLSVINPSDIESMNVLKDATAGIYGVQAANGVIIITTKSGRKGTDFKFTFNSYTGVQQTTRKIPLLNATEYALLANEAYAANGESLPFSNISSLGQGTNWQDEVFKSAFVSSSDISVSKGYEKVAFNFSASYLDQDGIVGLGKSNFNRFTSKLNINADILKNLKLTSSVIYTKTNRSDLAEDAIGSVLFNALNFGPNLTPRNALGKYTLTPGSGFGQEIINPLAQIASRFNNTVVNKIAPTLGLEYSFLDYFSAQAKIQYNKATVDVDVFNQNNSFGVSSTVFDVPRNGVYEKRTGYEDYIFDAFVKYERVFAEDHDVKFLLGTSVSNGQQQNVYERIGLDIPNGRFPNSKVTDADPSNIEDIKANARIPDFYAPGRLLSYFTRLQYNYKGKYLFSGVFRRDGSTKFGPSNKFGYFPSASIGWVASEESFLENSETISFLKFRASYGIVGNDRIAPFAFVSVLKGQGTYVFDNTLTYGTATGQLSNPEIRWEKQKPLDIGVELTLFNAIDIEMDYFNKRTEDLLLEPQVSGILGTSAPGSRSPVVNAGTVENKGFEFSIGYKKEVSEDFKFGVNYNFTTLKNEVILVANQNGFIEGSSFGVGQGNTPPSRMEAGYPIGYFYGYKTNGIFQTPAEVSAYAKQTNASPGDLRFVDINGDGEITIDDRTYIGDPIADITMGLNVSFDYKDFDFNAYAFASIGNEMVRNYERNVPLRNHSVHDLDRWTGPGTSTTTPRVTTGATGNVLFSDYFVEDASFVRLQTIQIGYTLNSEMAKKAGLNKLRFYIKADNLFTVTKYKGFDPTASNGEPIGSGIDKGFYPTPRVFMMGVNVNF